MIQISYSKTMDVQHPVISEKIGGSLAAVKLRDMEPLRTTSR